MKEIVLALLTCLFVASVQAQTFAEWFQQKKTQKKYLIQQIAGLQLYIQYAQKGYAIAQQGLNTISSIKQDDLNLHDDFYASLKKINPIIRNNSNVADIIGFQLKILKSTKRIYQLSEQSSVFSREELTYINRVLGRLLMESSAKIDELTRLINPDKLEMSDDQRLERINQLYLEMQDNYTFCQSFSDETGILSSARKNEKSEVERSRAISGIKQ